MRGFTIHAGTGAPVHGPLGYHRPVRYHLGGDAPLVRHEVRHVAGLAGVWSEGYLVSRNLSLRGLVVELYVCGLLPGFCTSTHVSKEPRESEPVLFRGAIVLAAEHGLRLA